jgi:hypothetical protein
MEFEPWMVGRTGQPSNFLRPELVPRLRELLTNMNRQGPWGS